MSAKKKSKQEKSEKPEKLQKEKKVVRHAVAKELASRMRVKKRDGSLEPVQPEKIIDRVVRAATGLRSVDPMLIATKTIGGLHDGVSTTELDNLAIHNAAAMLFEEPEYSKLAARLLSIVIAEEVATLGVHSFAQSIMTGNNLGIINDETAKFVGNHARELNAAIDDSRNDLFEYFGLRTVYERYLLKHPTKRNVFETPQYFFMRVSCGIAENVEDAIAFYNLLSSFDYMPSTPTLFNSGTTHSQMSSCFLLDAPLDNLESIYKRYWHIAALSKWSGGIGLSYTRVRSRGSLIKGTNGFSNGIIPWLKTLDDSVAAVNQGGKRKGACCVYLESWHADIEDFLEFRDTTGDQNRRARHMNIANWVPDLFMKRVKEGGVWSLFDPNVVPHFTDIFGEEFESEYLKAEAEGRYVKQVKAQDLYARMMKTLAETGNGWMCFKDASNRSANQTGGKGADGKNNVIHSSNLCTEILEVTSDGETAVCNLGSINLANYVVRGDHFDFAKLARSVKRAVPFLDRVIDLNFYPTEEARRSNMRWRPIGLGIMGLQDAFFKLGIPFDDPRARALSQKIQETIYLNALEVSVKLAEKKGACEAFAETKTAQGILHYDAWGLKPIESEAFDGLRERIKKTGLRNSLLLAIAPTATIASIVGSYESIEPQVAILFKRETMSGEFMQVNRYLVETLKKHKLWTPEIREQIKVGEGSIQHIAEIPLDIKRLFRTVWEIPMRSLIDMAHDRMPFLDQGQSLNLFIESPTISKLSSMYMHAWEQGLKTTYYLRSRPATSISKTTTTQAYGAARNAFKGEEKTEIADVIGSGIDTENPMVCDSCQ